MARTYADIQKDRDMLGKIRIGDPVAYKTKDGTLKRGTVSKLTSYGTYRDARTKYCQYKSVTVLLQDGGSHINVSPRNLILLAESE